MPLREEIEKAQSTAKSYSSKEMTILCFGGSQGSLFLNQKISDYVLSHPELMDRIKVIHQTGSLDYQNMKRKYADSAPNVELHEFIYDMPTFYKRADIQFCRGGASTIAEASAFGVVPIIVPLPAADDHQLRNAEAVATKEAGYLLIQDQFDDQKFAATIKELLENPSLRQQLSEKFKNMAPQQAASQIAQDVLSQIP
jgi:UDP-N-acetylglucosamine--N-acetylmuramyl-(pentapeptide) pyrophosphoryl-undecaprenol N-acetylglucosamine transferase